MPIDIKGKEYVTVAERVCAVHEDIKNKRLDIITEVVQHEPVVLVKAIVTIEGKGTFTGYSAANPDKAIEKQSPYEVAETSAVGRALGFAGYGAVESIASADEMIKAGVAATKQEDVKRDPTTATDKSFSKSDVRDSLGHTLCNDCGKAVSSDVEKYSLENFGHIFCFECQKKYKKKAAAKSS